MARTKANRATIADVAQAAGVAQSTVSRALSGHPAISEQTRNRVLDAARRLSYAERQNRNAAETRMVGVVSAALHNQFYVHLLDAIHDELAAYDYRMTLILDPLTQKEDYSAFDRLLHQSLDGILFTTATLDPRLAEYLHETNLPVVLAVRSLEGLPFDTVEVDNVVAGREAVRHLVALGHRRIGFIMGPVETSTSRDRFAGAVSAMADAGLPRDPESESWGAYTHASGYSSLLSLMGRPSPPTAVICGNDTIALGVLEAAHKHGIAVPSRLSVIGFDDIAMAGWDMVRLTTVRQPIPEIASTAVRRLVERMRGTYTGDPRHDILPVNLIQRATTGAPVKRTASLSEAVG